MAVPKIIGAQRDFSAGELDPEMKRNDDDPFRKAGARQLSNFRIRNSKTVTNRPGRTALFLETGRVDEILMSPGNKFYLCFGAGYLRVYNAAGARVFTTIKKGDGATAIPWTLATVKNISFAVAAGVQRPIYIAYGDGAPSNVPQVLTWDGVSQTSTWVLSTYTEDVIGFQKQTLFYRISAQNVRMLPGGINGLISLVFDAPVLSAASIGTYMTYVGRQMRITAVADSTHGTAAVQETLWSGMNLPFSVNVQNMFSVGDLLRGTNSGARALLTSFTNGGLNAVVQLLGPTAFTASETVVAPLASAIMSGAPSALPPQNIAVWDDEVMNTLRGYPTSVFYDQGRLGFCNFPPVPSGVAWSTIGVPTGLYVESEAVSAGSPDNAIFELVPGKSQVLYVIPGMESNEFVFCDNAIYYIPITPAIPLVPGSVAFNRLSDHGCLPNVTPQIAEQSIIYVKAGGVQIGAVQAQGAYNRPFIADNVSEFHSHLLTASTPIAIAISTAPNQFEELYAYVLLANGSAVIGKYGLKQGLLETGPDGKPQIGWLPWSGAGTVLWISARGSDVVFTTSYAPNGIAAVGVVELLDNTQYLDGAMAVNAAPTALAAPVGKGPLWWLPGGAVTLIDQGTRMMGVYQIDVDGNIIPQNIGGENLLSAALVAGQAWTATLEPFVPDAPPGQSAHQRMFKRRVSRMAVYVMNSTGFLMARLFSGPITPTSPALGTIMNTRRVTTWNQDDDPTQPPPLREEVERWRPIGRAYDPRVSIIKDTPGPLEILEIGIEATI